MGSIISKPKAPAPLPLPPPPPPIEVEPPEPVAEPVDTEKEKAKKRRQNLLRRDRGLFGTVKTGVSGVLSATSNEQSANRKTLLGE